MTNVKVSLFALENRRSSCGHSQMFNDRCLLEKTVKNDTSRDCENLTLILDRTTIGCPVMQWLSKEDEEEIETIQLLLNRRLQ